MNAARRRSGRNGAKLPDRRSPGRVPLRLEPRLRAILEQEYPRFSEAEYARRHRALGAVMERHGLDHLLVVTDHRAGNAPQWVTGWPGTVEAYVVFRPGERMWMSVEWVNHYPLAKKMCPHMEVVWGEHRGIELAVSELERRGAKRIGVIGPLLVPKYRRLEERFRVVALDAEYVRLRMVKSEEELDWLRIGAAMSDAGLAALLAGTRPGLTERELGALVESAYIRHGGTTMIHYIGVTSMNNPHIYVPPQHHSPRKVRKGDVVFCELSAYWWDYPGQVLRTFTVGAEATPLYRDLWRTAEDAFDAVTRVVRHGATARELLDATGLIEERGFTICDDLVHGFGGGYFQPIIGSKSRMAGPLPDLTLEENMTLVVQPNVITRDHRAGVQVGELIRVTKTGFERLHRAKRGLFRVG
jgi:Xaa-Pro aminopeptidase